LQILDLFEAIIKSLEVFQNTSRLFCLSYEAPKNLEEFLNPQGFWAVRCL